MMFEDQKQFSVLGKRKKEINGAILKQQINALKHKLFKVPDDNPCILYRRYKDQIFFLTVTIITKYKQLICLIQHDKNKYIGKKNNMRIKTSKVILSFVLILILASSMPTQYRIPSGIDSSQILLSDATIGKQMIVVLTKTQLKIYISENSESYRMTANKPACQASALTITQNGILPSGLKTTPSSNVAVGCKNGYFYLYQVSNGQIISSFAKQLDGSVKSFLSAASFLFVATESHISIFNSQTSKVIQTIPISGHLSSLTFDKNQNIIQGSDQISEIKIKISSNGRIQVNKKPKQPMIVRARLLQANTTTPVCGNGIFEQGEECDDGNTVDGDGCSATCKNQYCGDGTVNNNPSGTVNEQCDPGTTGNNTITLNSNTTNGTVTGCVNCKLQCGDGVLDSGQECDDGNNVDGDGCSASCMLENKQSYKAALGVGIGAGFLGVVGVIGGTAAGSTTGVASSLIGVAPGSLGSAAGGQVGQLSAQMAGQGISQGAGQGATAAAQI